MAGKTLEAKLRIAADVADAVAGMRTVRSGLADVRQEAAAVSAATSQATASVPTAPADGGADAATQGTRRRTDAERAATAEEKRLARERVDAERAAQREKKRLADQAETQRKAQLKRQQADETAAAAAIAKAQRQQANLQRQLAPQVTDIAVGLATGQSPFMVALQQGGQLRDLFAGSGGLAGAAKMLLSALTPLRLLLGGVAAGIGLVATAAAQSYLDVDRFNKTLALTGNQANTSWGEVKVMGDRIARSTGNAIGDVRETLQALLAAGGQTRETLASAGAAAAAYQKITGASAGEAAQLFEGQGDAVLAWSTKANKAYRFLTAAQLEHIRTLQSQGRNADAVRFANEELAKTLEQRSVPAIGGLEQAWRKVGQAFSTFWDNFKGSFQPETLDDRIKRLAKQLSELPAPGRGWWQAPVEAVRSRVQGELETTQESKRADQRAAAAAAERQAAEDRRILEGSKAYTDADASMAQAASQKKLAIEQAYWDRKRDLVEANRASVLISEQEAAQDLAAIEQQRLVAQEAALQRQLAITSGRKTETPLDVKAQAAEVTQLQAQLVDVRSQITSAQAKGQQLLASDATAQATRWEQAWKDAAQRIRQYTAENDATAVERIADPERRAEAAAELATRDARGELAQQRQKLQFQVDIILNPQKARELQQQVDELVRQGQAAIDETSRKVRFDSLATQAAQVLDQLGTAEAALDQRVAAGALTTEEAERRKLTARRASIPLLEQLIELQALLAAGPADQAALDRARAQLAGLKSALGEVEKTARSAATGELTQFLDDVTTGAKSTKNALIDMVGGFAKAMLNVLNQRLAEKLVNQFMDAAKSGGGSGSTSGNGGWMQAIGTWIASLFHTGGVVGDGSAVQRAVSPAAFAGAQVLHAGGVAASAAAAIPGLASNETPAILLKGEEVLTRDDPRHRRNLGADWLRAAGRTLAPLFHGGGLVGSGLAGMARAVSPALFAGAQILHSGGIAGLADDETPAILRKGEEVLTESDPRHRKNFSGGGVTVNMSVTVNGAGGSQQDQAAELAMLQQMMQATVERWAANQQRQGGILTGVRNRG